MNTRQRIGLALFIASLMSLTRTPPEEQVVAAVLGLFVFLSALLLILPQMTYETYD